MHLRAYVRLLSNGLHVALLLWWTCFIPSFVLVINALPDKGACCIGKRTVRESEGDSNEREQCAGMIPLCLVMFSRLFFSI